MMTPRGLKTRSLYRSLNSAASPLKVILFSAGAGDEIYVKPRIDGGLYYYQTVPVYPRDMDPLKLIDMQAADAVQRAAEDEHESSALAGAVGRELYSRSPQAFVSLAREILEKKPSGEEPEPRLAKLIAQYQVGRRAPPCPLVFRPGRDKLQRLRSRILAA